MYLKTSLKGDKVITNAIQSIKLQLELIYKELSCRTIDIVNLNEDISIICDDEGLLISGNPVFQIVDDNGNVRQIAGTFLIAHDVMTEDGRDARGFKNVDDAVKLMGTTSVEVIDFTK